MGGGAAIKFLPRTVPYSQCSEVYKRYCEVEGIRATYLKDYRLNDTVTVGVTLLEAETEARKVVAYPGTSEHQLGLCVDIMDSKDTTMKAEEVENLPVLKWLQQHCTEYGFILRYPKDKQEITGWYEPWHFRYVGEEAAKYITENNLCLEEFIALF